MPVFDINWGRSTVSLQDEVPHFPAVHSNWLSRQAK